MVWDAIEERSFMAKALLWMTAKYGWTVGLEDQEKRIV
jgi:hypothetical protein